MVRMQGDFAKPPEKRLNYKNSIHGLYRVCATSYPDMIDCSLCSCDILPMHVDDQGRRVVVIESRRGSQRLPCDLDECQPVGFVSTSPDREARIADLRVRYDFFKASLLKTGYFEDNIYVHTTASFAAVGHLISKSIWSSLCHCRVPWRPRFARLLMS